MASPKRTKKPSIPVSKIPSVKELVEKLGFQRASVKDETSFHDSTHAWRKAFKSSSGRSGPELLQWNQIDVQLDLTELAEKFLQDGNNTDRFWSPTRSWSQDSDLQYPEDKAVIIDLLKQLFWKQNRYAANNSAYGHKATDSKDGSRDLTPTHQAAPSGSKSPAPPGAGVVKLRLGKQPQAKLSTALEPLFSRLETNEAAHGSTNMLENDIFEGPSDSEFIKLSTESSTSPSSKGLKRARGTKPSSRDDPSPNKRVRRAPVIKSPRRTERKPIPRFSPGRLFGNAIPESEDSSDLSEPETRGDDDLSRMPSKFARSLDPAQKEPREAHLGQVTHATKSYIAPFAPMVSAKGPGNPEPTAPRTYPFTPPTPPLRGSSHQSPKGSNISSQERRGRELGGPTSLSDAKVPPTGAGQLPGKFEDEEEGHPTKSYSPSMPSISSTTKPSSGPGLNSLSSPAFEPVLKSHEALESDRRPYPEVHHDPHPSSTEDVQLSTPSAAAPEKSTPHLSDSRQPPNRPSAVHPSAPRPSATQPPAPHSPPFSDLSTRSVPSETLSSKPRSKTQVPLWIITHNPRYTEERWDAGKFVGTPLPFFIEELSKETGRGHIEKMKLTLSTPTFDTKITVYNEAEDSWNSAKETFVEKLKEARAEARKRHDENPSFKILIEPFYRLGTTHHNNIDEDDEEFDF